MGVLTEYISDKAYDKALDADFQTVMRSVNFNRTPREVLTLRDMERRYVHKVRDGLEVME